MVNVSITFSRKLILTEIADATLSWENERLKNIPAYQNDYHSFFIQKFGFIKRVDKGWITTVKDLESWRFER